MKIAIMNENLHNFNMVDILRVGSANTCFSCLLRVNADFAILCQVFISFSQPLLSTRHILHTYRVSIPPHSPPFLLFNK